MRNSGWNTHERITDEQPPEGPTERNFGIVFAVVFALIGSYGLYKGASWWPWLFVASGITAMLAFLAPALLRPFNKAWTAFGLLLHRFMSPIIMGLIYVAGVMPTAVVMRMFGIKPLDLAFDKNAKSYWISREESDPHPDSLKRQF